MGRVFDRKQIYVIAQGEGLTMIKKLEAEREKLLQNVRDVLPANISIGQAWDNGSQNYITFQIDSGDVPELWSRGNHPFPDIENDAVRTPVIAYMNSTTITEKFNTVCQKQCGGNSNPLTDYYTYEKVGDLYIVTCPMQDTANTVFVLPDSKIISVEQYRQLRIEAGKDRPVNVIPFPAPGKDT